ncbi:MAG: hypothetical protein J6U12_04035 [Candidatus Methanomethylophilaceae archaeon]|nr:hypothetical protein [Candidatus Methanomethylophilaceae archaeon]
MDISDIHLEKALSEYNSTVNLLEAEGTSAELVEAYVNRGCILYMMGYFTSAMEDLSSASNMIEEIESEGGEIDAGTYVKAHATMGAILFEQHSEISEEYGYAISRLPRLKNDSKHFDKAGIIRMCIESAENLLDSEYPEDATQFIAKGLDILERSTDKWSGNRKMELYTLMGECYMLEGELRSAMEQYSEAVTIGTMLVDNHEIESMEELVVPIIARSQCESDLGLDDMYLADLELAIGLLEEMAKANKLEDPEVLVHMHQDAAAALMNKGKVKEAEKHLMQAVSMGVQGAKDYLINQTNAQF